MNTRNNDRTKEDIRSRVSIEAVVGRYVALKRRGGSLMGLCPFHKEKSPSFTVSPDRGLFYCFGCGKGGDVFHFVQEMEGVGFREALEMLAEEAGVTLEKWRRDDQQYNGRSSHSTSTLDKKVSSNSNDHPRSPHNAAEARRAGKAELLAVHNEAAEFFYNRMKGNKRVIEYFKSRGLTGETVKDFRLGYAPAGWSELCDHLRKKGIPMNRILECGLAVSKDNGNTYDRFRDRVIFPLRDIGGKIVAFAGRGMDAETQPKYLNSPETAIYKKSGILYGLDRARESAREAGFLIVIEGYMDYLTLYQAGIKNAAAVSGTAFTADHAKLIKRVAKRAVLVFDGDNAGRRAAARALFVLAPHNIQTSVLTLSGDDDPDSFVKREGAAAFTKLLDDAAKGAEDFLIDEFAAKSDGSAHGKSAVIDELAPYARSLTDTIVASAFIDKLALRLRVDRKLVTERVSKLPAAPIYNEIDDDRENITSSHNNIKPSIPIAMGALEESFLRLLVSKPAFIIHARRMVTPEIITDDLAANVYYIMLEEYARSGNLDGLLDACGGDGEMVRAVSMLSVKPAFEVNLENELEQKIRLLRIKNIKARIAELNATLLACPEEDKMACMESIKTLGARLKELEQPI